MGLEVNVSRHFEAGDVYPSSESRKAIPGDKDWYERFGAPSSLGWNGIWSTETMPEPEHRDAAIIDTAELWLRQQSMGPWPDKWLMQGLAMAMAMEGHHEIGVRAAYHRIDHALKEDPPDPDKVVGAFKAISGFATGHRSKDLEGAAQRIEQVLRTGHEKERENGRNFRAWVIRHDQSHNARRDLVSLAVMMFGMSDVAVIDERAIAFLTGVRASEGLFEMACAKEGFYRMCEDGLRKRAPEAVLASTEYALLAASAWYAAGKPHFRAFWSLMGSHAHGKSGVPLLGEAILYSLSRFGGGATALGLANVFGGALAAANGDVIMPPTAVGEDGT